MNKSQLEDDIFFGDHAKTLTTNPAYQAAIARIKARIFEQWANTGFFQRKERKELWRLMRTVGDFEKELELMMRDGQIAQKDLKRTEKSVK